MTSTVFLPDKSLLIISFIRRLIISFDLRCLQHEGKKCVFCGGREAGKKGGKGVWGVESNVTIDKEKFRIFTNCKIKIYKHLEYKYICSIAAQKLCIYTCSILLKRIKRKLILVQNRRSSHIVICQSQNAFAAAESSHGARNQLLQDMAAFPDRQTEAPRLLPDV